MGWVGGEMEMEVEVEVESEVGRGVEECGGRRQGDEVGQGNASSCVRPTCKARG